MTRLDCLENNMARMIDAFREKYPQYANIDDITLAEKVSSKYPQYSQMLDEARPADSKKSIFPTMETDMGKSGAGAIALDTLQGTGQDLTAIPAHFFNQYLLNAPRSLTETYTGYEYPEETTSPTAGVLAKTAGVLGALQSPASKMVTAGGTLPTQMAKGAMVGAAYSPEDFGNLEQRAVQGIVGGAIPLGLKGLQTGMKLGGKLGRRIAGVGSKSIKWLKERGTANIFDPLKEQVDYVQTTLAPKANEIYQESVKKFTPTFQKYAIKTKNMSESAAKTISKYGTDAVNSVRDKLDDSVVPILNVMDDVLNQTKEQAAKLYDDALDTLNVQGKKIMEAKNTTAALTKTLKDNGMIDDAGNIYSRFKDKDIPRELKIMVDMYDDLKNRGGVWDSNDWKFTRRQLRQAQKGKTEWSKDLQDVISAGYDDLEAGGGAKINDARGKWKLFKQAEDKYGKIMNERKMNRFQKMTSSEKGLFKQFDKEFGTNISDDLNILTSARELDKLDKLDAFSLGKKLQGATDLKTHNALRGEMRPLFGDMTDEIFDNIKDHIVAQQLSGKSPIGSTSESRIIPAFIKGAAKEYYQKGLPLVEKAKKGARTSLSTLKGLQNI